MVTTLLCLMVLVVMLSTGEEHQAAALGDDSVYPCHRPVLATRPTPCACNPTRQCGILQYRSNVEHRLRTHTTASRRH